MPTSSPEPSDSRPKPLPPTFPSLPIVTIDQARLSQKEKYGGLYYLGIAGLLVLIGLIAWFSVGVWSNRTLWTNIYVLHDASRAEDDRIRAAFAISRDPRANQRQRWDISLRRTLPPLARYVIAESLTAEAAEADPRGYALSVALSEDWPDWLRLLLVRPMAYGAHGKDLPPEALDALGRHADPFIRVWAEYVRAVSGSGDEKAAERLRETSRREGPARELAEMLWRASKAPEGERAPLLDRATRWLRTNDPEAARLWSGWEERDGRLVRGAASKLH